MMFVPAICLLLMAASGFDAGSAWVFCWGCLFLHFADDAASGVDAGSAWVFCWGCLFLQVFANDAGSWC